MNIKVRSLANELSYALYAFVSPWWPWPSPLGFVHSWIGFSNLCTYSLMRESLDDYIPENCTTDWQSHSGSLRPPIKLKLFFWGTQYNPSTKTASLIEINNSNIHNILSWEKYTTVKVHYTVGNCCVSNTFKKFWRTAIVGHFFKC